jgi:hypothetical protein
MTRFVVTLIAFALPFILFWIYMRVQSRRAARGHTDPWPMAVLWLTGAILAVEAIALTAVTAPKPGAVYHPARIENGQVIPPRFEYPIAPAPTNPSNPDNRP